MGGTAELHYVTRGGIRVTRAARDIAYQGAIGSYVERLDSERGAVFSSSYEFPGRYTRWDIAFVNPPLVVEAQGRQVTVTALNARGRVLLPAIEKALTANPVLVRTAGDAGHLTIRVAEPEGSFTEEERSRQPTVFTAVRELVALFGADEDPHLGLAGAFGYDLAFQFEPLPLKLERPADQRDLVLYLPDQILIVDHYARRATVYEYDFGSGGASTAGLPRDGAKAPFRAADIAVSRGDHVPGEYAQTVARALDYFRRGDLFEVVPGQTFTERCVASPSAISRRLAATNPAPYGFFMNLGNAEWLVGASPEMFVRVTAGRRVETCPISGTIARGRDAIEDEAQIRKLLNSRKDEAELTMCSDVDRNDKARVCEAGTVRVLGRRQIEMYSRLIHTVDHIEGLLRDGMDALDAFLSHAWAVTVTGAPKKWAMRFVEEHEKSPRAWYGGAIGIVHFNGDLNTGLTLRTVRIKNGIAEVRAGATVLFDSVPMDEERETELKASAMLAAIREAGQPLREAAAPAAEQARTHRRILLVDHEDSFVHTLADYFRRTGAEVTTLRVPVLDDAFDRVAPDLVVMSPGPGRPSDFDCSGTIARARARGLPIFGVCLGLQALTEYFGGRLDQLALPMHGKPSVIHVSEPGHLFAGLPAEFTVGRYHSLIADTTCLPAELKVTATTDDGVVMAIEHVSEPIAAVQFHPESIMTLAGDAGMTIVRNALSSLYARQKADAE
ncbi:anthranilate synthase component I [Pseudoxanthobacter sp.]|uniref:anthranilate synthase component I n=1 Tax=Pseudoxanthobacter sp. TaxID=1925742 RepID=UPI002FE3780D